MKKIIANRISAHKRSATVQSQRAELLSRNTTFINELDWLKEKVLSKEFFAVKNHIQKGRSISNVPVTKITRNGEIERSLKYVWPQRIATKRKIVKHFERLFMIWEGFCKKWNIRPEWNSDISSLKKNQESHIALYLIEGSEESGPALLLKINNWTVLKDIRDAWGQIEEYRCQIWERQEKKGNFSRDLLWHDLVVKHGCRPREIAQVWAEKFPNEIDILVVRGIRNSGEIDKKDLKGRSLDDYQLLEAIKNGFLADKYNAYFEKCREFYIRGVSSGKKVNPPLIDMINKAIKRMKSQIKNIKDSSLKTSIDIEQVLSMGQGITSHSR